MRLNADDRAMTGYFLGVDVGGTKSHALVATGQGEAVGFGAGGPGNHEMVGYDGLTTVLREITGQALGRARVEAGQIAGAGFGIAGYDWPSELAPTLDAIDGLGLVCPVEVVNDTLAGLMAGAAQGWGVAVTAGTSNNCWGWDAEHRVGRMVGHGPRFGEYGGAEELVDRAIAAVARAWTRRGPETALTQHFCRLAGAADAAELLEGLSQGWRQIGPEAAPVVFEAAQEGDAVAASVIQWAGAELGDLAAGVIRQLGLERQQFEVVLAGSLFEGGALLVEPMQERVQAAAPGAVLTRLTAPPVTGAVLLGMQKAGLDTSRLRQAVTASTNAYLAANPGGGAGRGGERR